MNGDIAILNKYPAKDYNVLMASTATQMTAWHKIILCETKIDPDPDSGDVYPQGGKLAFSKQALMRLADAAGIRFVGTDSERHEDMSVTATVHGVMTKADGIEHQLIGTYTWDVPNRLEQVRLDIEKYEQKSSRKLSNTDTAQRMIDVRKFAFMRAETGAIERLIRSALGLRSTYSKADLDKTFVIARVVTDMSQDPMMRFVTAMRLAGGRLGEEEIKAIVSAMSQQPQPQAQIEQAEPVAQIEAGGGPEPEPDEEPPIETVPNGSSWIEQKAKRAHFWAWVNEQGLTHDEVHEALRVSTLKGWLKPMDVTKELIVAWRDAQIEAETAERIGSTEGVEQSEF